MNYFRSKAKNTMNKKYELISSAIITIILFFLILGKVQPIQSVIDFGDYLTESWENEKTEPPVPHAELLTIKELSKTVKISIIKIQT